MKKIILATIGLAMFATPVAAENPHSGYPNAERYRSGPPAFSASHALAPQQRAIVAPSGTTASFGLALPGSRPGFGSSASSPWHDQDLRDRYGRINR